MLQYPPENCDCEGEVASAKEATFNLQLRKKDDFFFTENEKPKTQLTERDRLLFPSRTTTTHPNGSLSVPVTPVNKFQSGRQTQRGGGRNNVKLKVPGCTIKPSRKTKSMIHLEKLRHNFCVS